MSSPSDEIRHLAGLDENRRCADCDKPMAPLESQASLAFGVFVCSLCGSVHESLGHSIVRSVWGRTNEWDPESVSKMRRRGNRLANAYYERHVPLDLARPGPSASRELLVEWIKAKYISLLFLTPTTTLASKANARECGSRAVLPARFVDYWLLLRTCTNPSSSPPGEPLKVHVAFQYP